jgi:hypothetical protein
MARFAFGCWPRAAVTPVLAGLGASVIGLPALLVAEPFGPYVTANVEDAMPGSGV